MQAYDPLTAPDPIAWLGLDEAARLRLVEDYHVQADIELANARVHSLVHVAVETQIAALDPPPVREKLRQLMAQGLDRHDAIHGIGSVFIKHMHAQLLRGAPEPVGAAQYVSALRRLTAKKWMQSE